MSEKKRNPVSSLERQLTTYPHQKYYSLTIAYARNQLLNQSKTIEYILKDFFDKLPQEERNKLMLMFDKMTPEERKHPHRL